VAESFAWGILAGSSLVLGGLVPLLLPISRRLLGIIMAFGAGVLGLFAGAGVFFLGDTLIDRLGGSERKSSSGSQAAGSALAIVLGIVLDGIPESLVLGATFSSTTPHHERSRSCWPSPVARF
jgi:zinc transporter, ZIP family